MSSYLLFLILGLGSGATYAILGQGLVLKYRSAGVVDFAHGAVAMFIAYVFVNLRSFGELELPLVLLPHQISLNGGNGVSTGLAIAISLVYAAVLGLLLYVIVYRPLQSASPLTRVCASVGVMLTLQAIAVLNYSTEPVTTNPIFPSSGLSLAGVTFPEDRLFFTGVVVVISVALALVYRYSRFGLATRAGAENDKGAALTGISATRIAGQNWVIATVLAGVAGILIAPISSLDPTSYTLFVVPALAAALIGRIQSFWITALAGLLIGCAQSEIDKLVSVFGWLPQQGLPDSLPFVVIIVVMAVRARSVLARGGETADRNPSVGLPRAPLRTAAVCFVIGLILLFTLDNVLRFAFISSLTVTAVALSVVVLTGYVGQVSLAQMSLAGIGGFMLGHISTGLGHRLPVVAAPGRALRGAGRAGHRPARAAAARRQPGGGHARVRLRPRRGAVHGRELHRRHRRPADPAAAAARPEPGHQLGQRHQPGRVRGARAGRRHPPRAACGPAAARPDRPHAAGDQVQRARGGLGRHQRRPGQAARVRAGRVHRRHRRRAHRLHAGRADGRQLRRVHLDRAARDRVRGRGRADRRARSWPASCSPPPACSSPSSTCTSTSAATRRSWPAWRWC